MDYKEVQERLKKFGYKLTSQREEVFNLMMANKHEHLTPEEIYNIMHKSGSDVGIATVYRTLLLFDKIGIVQKLNIDENGTKYELVDELETHHHHHLICSSCGKVEEVRLDLLNKVEKDVEKSYGFVIQNHDLKFYGYCRECINKNKKGE